MVNSDYTEALLNMGNSYNNLEELDGAIACYENVLKIDPKCALAHFCMGLVYNKLEKKDDAISCFQKVVELDLDLPGTYSVLYINLRLACDWKLTDLLEKKMVFDHCCDKKLDEKTNEVAFASLARTSNPAKNLAAARAENIQILQSLSEVDLNFDFSSRSKRKRKKTIGYYSGNFKDHPNGHQTHAVFGCHNREEFEIICYSSGKDDGSLYRNKIKDDCDRFIDIREISDVDAAKQIYQDQVDILVDLAGPIDGGRPGMCALRPAPVQIRYLGMAGTSGADYYDYLVTDRIVTPDVDAPFYTEKFINMPHCYMVNSIQPVSTKKLKREDFGLPENGFVFCSFNTSYKFDRDMFHAWMEILLQVPESVLWLLALNKAAEINLKNEAESCGVDSERIVFSEKLPKPRHLARIHLADLALDTRVVNGAASTCDFLRMGLPIITLKGSHFSSRMSAGILTAMGLPELITHDLKQYRDLAVQLATSERLEKIRTWLDKNRHSNPLFDTRRFVRNLENAYKEVWDIYTQGREPRQIDVKESTEAN